MSYWLKTIMNNNCVCRLIDYFLAIVTFAGGPQFVNEHVGPRCTRLSVLIWGPINLYCAWKRLHYAQAKTCSFVSLYTNKVAQSPKSMWNKTQDEYSPYLCTRKIYFYYTLNINTGKFLYPINILTGLSAVLTLNLCMYYVLILYDTFITGHQICSLCYSLAFHSVFVSLKKKIYLSVLSVFVWL